MERNIYNIITDVSHPTIVARWLVDDVHSHPLWNQYYVSLFHLRNIPNVQTIKKDFGAATHKFMIFALEPSTHYTIDELMQHTKDGKSIALLTPVNVIQQFTAANDAKAMEKAENALQSIISMDSDYQSVWKEFLLS